MGIVHYSLAMEAAWAKFPDRQVTGLEKVTFVEPITVAPGETAKVSVVLSSEDNKITYKNRYSRANLPFKDQRMVRLVSIVKSNLLLPI